MPRTLLFIVTLAVFILSACQGQQSVVKDAEPAASPSASPSATATPESAASPSPSTAPAGQTPTPAASPEDISKMATTLPSGPNVRQSSGMGSLPGAVTQPYKPTPTPGDPFPPRPTPTVVMAEGKIVQEWQAPAEAANLTNPVKDAPNAARIGEAFYMQRCVDCHGKRGYGNGVMSRTIKKPPTNLASRMVQANTDGELYWKITNGRSPMPANHQRFTDEQRWYIVTFLRTLK